MTFWGCRSISEPIPAGLGRSAEARAQTTVTIEPDHILPGSILQKRIRGAIAKTPTMIYLFKPSQHA
jgi:hypothetical protein